MTGSAYNIRKVTLKSGFISTLEEKSKCPALSFEGEAIPGDILETLKREDYKTLKLRYGDPSWGEPIQYHLLIVEDQESTKTIEVFNIALLLFFHNTEEIRRLHRIIYAIERYKEKQRQ